MIDRTRLREPSPDDDGAAGLLIPFASSVDEIEGWDHGVAYVEAVLVRLIADRTAAADSIRAGARGAAIDEARAWALAHVVGEAVRAAVLSDAIRETARLELEAGVRQVLPLHAVAVEVLARLDEAIATMRTGLDELAALVAREASR